MRENLATWDRTIRIALGIALIAMGAAFQNWWGLIGIAPYLSGLTGRCPLYGLLGLSTLQRNREDLPA